jgi:NAD(P)-dependent dehydrogenase (short-subunit alcohol dehydrogenase family)
MSKGLVVLIGAGPHSGAGVARSFARSGYALALLARTEDKLKALAKDLQGQGFTAEAFPSDTSSSSLTKAFQAIEERFGSLPSKCAIFHVKNSFRRPFLETSEADFRAAYEDYVVGAFNFSQAALPRMLEKGGTLIFTGTLGAMRTNAQYAAYGVRSCWVSNVADRPGRELAPLCACSRRPSPRSSATRACTSRTASSTAPSTTPPRRRTSRKAPRCRPRRWATRMCG